MSRRPARRRGLRRWRDMRCAWLRMLRRHRADWAGLANTLAWLG